MDAAFATAISAAAQPGHRCLGLELQPISVGHLFLLAELGNQFPDHAEDATLADLVTAVLICSTDRKDARKLLRSRFAPLGMKLWGWLMRKRSLRAEASIFQDFLLEQLQRPEDEGGEVGEMKAPFCWRLLAMLMSDFHLSLEEGLDMPVSIALCLWATEADRRGVVNLLSERQLNFRRWVAEQEAIRLGKKKEEGQ